MSCGGTGTGLRWDAVAEPGIDESIVEFPNKRDPCGGWGILRRQ